MQILLCEDDGIFFEGVPRNVILLVKFDDGKQIRVPYSAEKSISAMYEDLNRIYPFATRNYVKEDESKPLEFEEQIKLIQEIPNKVEELTKDIPSRLFQSVKEDKAGVIEKEDIVTLVKLESRGEGASCDLMLGHEYRIISIVQSGVTLPGSDKITQVVHGYDVVNDNGDRPERTRVFPHEVALKRKRIPPPVAVKPKVEEILRCPMCDALNALVLEGSNFEGTCQGCSNPISIGRIIKKCQTDKCHNDVSCFDVGGKYQGTCNKCKALIEVSYE